MSMAPPDTKVINRKLRIEDPDEVEKLLSREAYYNPYTNLTAPTINRVANQASDLGNIVVPDHRGFGADGSFVGDLGVKLNNETGVIRESDMSSPIEELRQSMRAGTIPDKYLSGNMAGVRFAEIRADNVRTGADVGLSASGVLPNKSAKIKGGVIIKNIATDNTTTYSREYQTNMSGDVIKDEIDGVAEVVQPDGPTYLPALYRAPITAHKEIYAQPQTNGLMLDDKDLVGEVWQGSIVAHTGQTQDIDGQMWFEVTGETRNGERVKGWMF